MEKYLLLLGKKHFMTFFNFFVCVIFVKYLKIILGLEYETSLRVEDLHTVGNMSDLQDTCY